jgi:gliding motility-associated-like protein
MTKRVLYTTVLILFIAISITSNAQESGLIINEVTNGEFGNKEFIELLVVGNPCETVNIQHWIVDDNNGDFSDGPTAGEGIADGHMRFTNHIQWSSLTPGTIIVLYNSADKNSNLPPDDISDSNNDDVYVLPSNSGLVEFCGSKPTPTDASYLGCFYNSGSDFQPISLRGDGDAVQTRMPNASFFHGLSYGTTGGNSTDAFDGGIDGLHFDGTGSKTVFYFSGMNYRDVASFTKGSALTDESPGAPNNSANTTFINNLKSSSGGTVELLTTDTFYCAGDSVLLVAKEGYDTYEWIDGTFNDSIWITAPGDYWVKASLFGCEYSDTTAVTVSTPLADAGLADTICRGNLTFLRGNGNGFPKWSPDIEISDVDIYQPFVQPAEDIIYTLTVTDLLGCIAKDEILISVIGPKGDLVPDGLSICFGDIVDFSIENASDVNEYSIDFGDGTPIETIAFNVDNQKFSHRYNTFPPNGDPGYAVILSLFDDAGCKTKVKYDVYMERVIAGFDRNTLGEPNHTDSSRCFEPGLLMEFINTSEGLITWSFDYGDGSALESGIGSNNPTSHIYQQAGVYDVSLVVRGGAIGCTDSITKTLYLQDDLVINFPLNDTIQACHDGNPIQLEASAGAGTTYNWSPGVLLNDSTISNPLAIINATTLFHVEVEDLSGCEGEADLLVHVIQQSFLEGRFDCDIFGDTTIMFGESIQLNITNASSEVAYTWTPTDYLSCSNCPNPRVIEPQESIEYTVNIKDASDLACFDNSYQVCINVNKKESIDVPSGFSPNGDGVNDIVFVNGWGIDQLISFEIYNRWGDLVFETSDKTQGWNGAYQGVIQEQDVYIYQVVATFKASGEKRSKQGNITLFR